MGPSDGALWVTLMKININRWHWGSWETVSTYVVRVTKTMIVVGRGRGEERFNRRTGWVAGHAGHGMAGMTDPVIHCDELRRFEAELKAREAQKEG
jgi:hypothetical protein